MFDWLTHRALTTRTSAFRIAPRIVNDSHPTAGEYELLHKYLRDRFANRRHRASQHVHTAGPLDQAGGVWLTVGNANIDAISPSDDSLCFVGDSGSNPREGS